MVGVAYSRREMLGAFGGLIVVGAGCASGGSRTSAAVTPDTDRAVSGGAAVTTALASATTTAAPTTEVKIAYGPGADQFGVLSVPSDRGQLRPVVVLIHGGFWKMPYGLSLMVGLATDLKDRGFAVWNIEYRRVGQPGGGYPGTLADVAAAIDHLAKVADAYRLDLAKVVTVGHSAGGHLALWANSRSQLRPNDPGAAPLVQPNLAVGLAAVVNLADAANRHLGGDAVQDLLGGGPTTIPDVYRVAQPALNVGQILLIHGSVDNIVPSVQSTAAATGHANVIVHVLENLDHFDMIDATSPAWSAVIERLST